MQYAAVVIKPGRQKPITQRHPWVFSGAISQIPTSAADGEVVDVVDANGIWLSRGYLNRASQIQLRLLTWEQDEVINEEFWRRRLAHAIALRTRLIASPNGATGETNAYRLVNGESDGVPGLLVDRYADYLVLQAGTLYIDGIKQQLAVLLQELTGCTGVLERSDTAARRQEGLVDANQLLVGGAPTGPVNIRENGFGFWIDFDNSQKTGFYMDQRSNRKRVAAYCAQGRVLNAFSYTGAFAVYALAAGANSVVNIDTSIEALEAGELNFRHNGFDPDLQTESIAGDVFQVLRDWRYDPTAMEPFDVVILDPPKFAHNRQHLDRALRGYKDINMLALQLLKPGGILATFSCSGLVSADLFQKVLFGAALDVGRSVQILERLSQDVDHPVALTVPEAEYLKGFICHVS
jgi:23S rRNA (cytosine1962-C5)-methyltransferase